MITLEEIDESIFQIVTRMKLTPEQQKYVAPNIVSLAQAWLYKDAARPLAIMEDGEPVGFMMLDWDEGERTLGLWRFMIAADKQGQGRGRKALEALIEMAKDTGLFDMMHLDYVKGNDIARRLYYSMGFRENGKVEDNEIIMTLPLTDFPKIGSLTADMDDYQDIAEIIDERRKVNEPLPDCIANEDAIKEAIKAGRITRLTLMGDTIGFTVCDRIVLSEKHSCKRKEAEEMYSHQ